MAYVINKTTKEIRRSVHTPDYDKSEWLINPPIPEGVPRQYLKIEGDKIVEMTQEEKDAVDRNLLDKKLNQKAIVAIRDRIDTIVQNQVKDTAITQLISAGKIEQREDGKYYFIK